ncbi:acyltransferase 3 [Candidatus Magnetobacterium bavaricum]|uniref:Acyltransferase 3 n=1 Tax=Candidatus Magnetobacterium bavaricum TaxID=29290 RepID=A0A0F3GUL9_9BACT|nr:acyltransferase 3 [Candidatus Magnetobacterium bavaricum]
MFVAMAHMGYYRGPVHIGTFAVIVFYLLSGYSMTHSFLHDFEADSKNIIPFYIDRFLRIYPLYVCCFLLSIIFVYITKYGNPHYTPINILFNLAIPVLNFNYYFGDTIQILDEYHQLPIMPQAWSLGTEVQFYAIIPFLLILLKNRRTLLFLAIISISLLWFSINLFEVYQALLKYNFDYLMLPPVLFIFLSGSLIYLNNTRFNGYRVFKYFLIVVYIYVFVCLIIASLKSNHLSQSYAMSIAYLIGVPVLYFISKYTNRISLDNFLGGLSYPIFLCHYLCIWFFDQFIAKTLPDKEGLRRLVLLATFTIIAGFISYMLDSQVQKFRKHIKRLRQVKKNI